MDRVYTPDNQFAPRPTDWVNPECRHVSNPTDAQLIAAGYLIEIEATRPTTGEGQRVRETDPVIDRDAGTIRRAWVVEDVPPPEIPESVLGAAQSLASAVAELNAEFEGLNLTLADGYDETYAAIFEGVVPASDQSRVWARVDTAYRNLEYHVSKWQSGASAWDLLGTLSAALGGDA